MPEKDISLPPRENTGFCQQASARYEAKLEEAGGIRG
jgi:hypothetical protein